MTTINLKSKSAPLAKPPAKSVSDRPPALPHERDQGAEGQSTGTMGTGAAGDSQRRAMGQAKRDLDAGQVDTDLHATPGLDAARRAELLKRAT